MLTYDRQDMWQAQDEVQLDSLHEAISVLQIKLCSILLVVYLLFQLLVLLLFHNSVLLLLVMSQVEDAEWEN